MIRSLGPIRPVRVQRPVGAPLVRGPVLGAAAGRPPGGPVAEGAVSVNEPVKEPADGAAGAPAVGPQIADMLFDLGRLTRQGLLTPEEFATAKARLLGG
ncbi:SHOCT domain-containing protein [Kitasatospora sp. NBC_01246]|uniref:SHOCT domain-containing protein n=1 Tax=Kitasatospora sp. NBC_01246 TaxID=2903570 RepID=UPI002E308336|nr:SHOCT domain-containing protein [Kitasatospora sp. NBC_01246]